MAAKPEWIGPPPAEGGLGRALVPVSGVYDAVDSPYVENLHRPLTPTQQINAALHDLFDKLNERLFVPYLIDKDGNRLGPVPPCILTIQSFGRCKGFAAKAVWSDDHNTLLDQITIVFRAHRRGDVKDLAQTTAHEMMHSKQFRDGETGVKNYHNRQFADWMKSIGLQTSKTGEPGGAEIGTGMSDYVIEGGPFDRVMDEIIAEGFGFPWEAVDFQLQVDEPDSGDIPGQPEPPKPKDKSKSKFTCPNCQQIARANYTAKLACLQPGCNGVEMNMDSS